MRPGERIAGHYEIIRPVNTGGLSVVYAAEDVRSHEQVAIKIINVGQAEDALKERIDREVRILTELSHPHIVECFDSGKMKDSRMFLVLEWLEGQDLADYKASAPMSLRLVLHLVEQVAAALEVAHGKGIVHRDIKPANIYMLEQQMGSEPICKVLDFGVAKAEESAALTRAGAILGTPSYMAPEQANMAMHVDGRADIFSLGVVAYELVTGRLPWTSTTDLARLARILVEKAIPIKEINPDIPNAVAAMVDGMNAGDPDRRTPRASDVLRQVRSCLRELPPGVLDTIYTKDQKVLDVVVRAETLDVEPGASGDLPYMVQPSEIAQPPEPIKDGAEDTGGMEATRALLAAELPKAPSLMMEAGHPEITASEGDTHDPLLQGPKGWMKADPLQSTPDDIQTQMLNAVDPTEFLAPVELEEEDEAMATVALSAALLSPAVRPAKPVGAGPKVEKSDASLGHSGARRASAVRSKAVFKKTFDDQLSYVEHEDPSLLYGRVDEVDRLFKMIEQVTDGRPGHRQAAIVVGPAGIGKTRLRTELGKLVQSKLKGTKIFAGRAEESFSTTPFAFVRRMIFAQAKIRADEPPAAQRSKIAALLPSAAKLSRLLNAAHDNSRGDAEVEQDSLAIDTMELEGSLVHGKSEKTGFALTDSLLPFCADRTRALFDAQDVRAHDIDTVSEKVPTLSGAPDAASNEVTPVNEDETRQLMVGFACVALGVSHPELPPLARARFDPRLFGEQLSASLIMLVRSMIEQSGLVVLIDDAHHLDHQSALCFKKLLESQPAASFAMVAFALPNLLDRETRRPSPFASVEAKVITLKPLDPRASREFARSLVKSEVDSTALETLVNRGAGNPLYLEQLMRAVLASGVLAKGESDEMVLHGIRNDGTDVDRVPPTVAAAVSTRMMRLKPRLAKLLSYAAVFGEVFWQEGVARISDRELEEVAIDMDQLLLMNFVRRRKQSRYRGETEMEFTHSVIRSVALSKLKRKKRGHLEERAADYLEDCGERDRAIIVPHVAQSGSTEEAQSLYMEAASHSLALGDLMSAGSLTEQGMRLVEEAKGADAVKLGDLRVRIAQLQKDWHSGLEALDWMASTCNSNKERLQLQLRRSQLLVSANQLDRARSVAEHTIDKIDVADRSLRELLGWGRLCLGEVNERLADGRGALRGFIGAHALLVDATSELLIRSILGLARVAVTSGDYRTAESRYREALGGAQQISSVEYLLDAHLGLSEVARLTGRFEEALKILDRLAPATIEPTAFLMLRLARARVWIDRGDIEQGLVLIEGCAKSAEHLAAADAADVADVLEYCDLMTAQLLRDRRSGNRCLRVDRKALAERLETALSRERRPAHKTATTIALAGVWAITGKKDLSKEAALTAKNSFEETGAVALDEAPCIFYTYARVLDMVGSSKNREKVRVAYKSAIAQLDSIASRLERDARTRYLERFTIATILLDAERAGLEIKRDGLSNRLVVED